MNRNILSIGIIGFILFVSGCIQQEYPLAEKGFLEGKISIGPLCPVQRSPPDPNCQPTEETYTAWPIAVYSSDTTIKIVQIEPHVDGTYTVELSAGNYVVDLEKQQTAPIGSTSLPATIVIHSGETTALNITLDTGIR